MISHGKVCATPQERSGYPPCTRAVTESQDSIQQRRASAPDERFPSVQSGKLEISTALRLCGRTGFFFTRHSAENAGLNRALRTVTTRLSSTPPQQCSYQPCAQGVDEPQRSTNRHFRPTPDERFPAVKPGKLEILTSLRLCGRTGGNFLSGTVQQMQVEIGNRAGSRFLRIPRKSMTLHFRRTFFRCDAENSKLRRRL